LGSTICKITKAVYIGTHIGQGKPGRVREGEEMRKHVMSKVGMEKYGKNT
jgi:hypothetical protein